MTAALAKSREDRRIRAFGPDGVLWRLRLTLEKAEQHIRSKRAVAQRNDRGVITCIHFYGESRKPLHSRFKAGTRYSYQEVVGCRRRWTHRVLPSVPLPSGLTGSELIEQLDLARRAAFQGVTNSVFIESPDPTPPSKGAEVIAFPLVESVTSVQLSKAA